MSGEADGALAALRPGRSEPPGSPAPKTPTPWLAFSIDRSSRTPVFEQICRHLRTQAASGQLREGTRLPPTRAFAEELGVSRSTIVTAYEQLVAEGYLDSRQGSGFTVCRMGDVELAPPPVPAVADRPAEEAGPPLPFQAGQPDMRLFPHRQWAKAISRLARTRPENLLAGGGPFGCFALRQAVAAHVRDWRGIEASPHQIVVTAGSGDGLELCLRALAATGDGVGLENPGYPPLRHFAASMGLRPVDLAVDEEGARLPEGNADLRLVVLTPSHQFPLGGAMAPGRRLALIRWAEERQGWIIEDDYDSEFRYAGRPIPAMAGFDGLKRTIYVGSFSKIFSNSLRLGYLIVPEGLVDRFRAALAQFGGKASYLPQQALADFIESGEFYRHLRRMRRIYGERRKVLLQGLAAGFGDRGWFRDHQAGMQQVFHLDGRYPDREVARRARALGLTIAPLSDFAAGDPPFNGLVLGYCAFTPEELNAGLDNFRRLLDRF